jgi:hypothetical protein
MEPIFKTVLFFTTFQIFLILGLFFQIQSKDRNLRISRVNFKSHSTFFEEKSIFGHLTFFTFGHKNKKKSKVIFGQK